MNPVCLLLSDDLIDASRVMGDGRAAGLTVVHCRDVARLLKGVENHPEIVVLDLHFPGLVLESIIPTIRPAASKLIGFGPHVDAARLKAARQAGCDEVLPRSAFFEGLEAKLMAWAQRKAESPATAVGGLSINDPVLPPSRPPDRERCDKDSGAR